MGTSKDVLVDEVWELQNKITLIKKERNKYKKAYNIMVEYFDNIPEEEKIEVNNKLDKLGV